MKLIFLVIIFFGLSSNAFFPQTLSWERTNGPYGGFISVIYQSSSGKIYAGARGLLYSKYSNEEGWNLALRTNTGSSATTIVENSQGEIFASFGIGTYHSIDNGVTWTMLSSGITGVLINKLTIDDQDNLYTTALISLTCRVFKSTDNGSSWNEIYSYSPTTYDFTDIKTGPDGLIIAGGSGPHKLIRSTNYGQTWNTINYSNLSGISRILIISNLEIYATETDLNKGIWKSTDDGVNWYIVSLAPSDQWISSIKNDSNNNLYLGFDENIRRINYDGYGGVYKSTDGGLTWENNLTFDLKNREVLCIEFIDNNKTWIGTYGYGVLELVTSDSTWVKKNSGLNDININSIAFDSSDNIWLCTSRAGIFLSTDSGNNWVEWSDSLLQPGGYEIKVTDDNSVFLAGAYGLYKFNFVNNVWTKILSTTMLGEGNIITCVEVKDRDTIFVGSTVGGIAVSYDNGENWVWNPPIYFGTSTIKVLEDRTVLAAGNSVYRTMDNGLSWQNFYTCGQYNHIKLEQTEEDFLLTACNELTKGYLFLSTDNGQTQTNLTENINNPYLSNLKYYNNRIFIGTTAEGIYLTTDYGVQWQSVNDGLYNLNIRSLAINDSGYIFAGTSEGLYRSNNPIVVPVEFTSFTYEINEHGIKIIWETASEINNRGFEIQRSVGKNSWTTIGFKEGKGTTTETQSYSFTDKNLQAGIYKYRLKQIDFNGTSGYSGIIEVVIDIPRQFALFQNYPNPFNPNTIIKYQLPEFSKVKLTVFDVLGREVTTLVNEEKPAGSYEVDFDGTDLPSGVYFYRIESGSFSDTKKFVLLK